MSSRVLIIALALVPLVGCGSLKTLQPWERDVLARKSMQLDAYPLDIFLDEHVYFSKEAATGGQSFGGGGCGCN